MGVWNSHGDDAVMVGFIGLGNLGTAMAERLVTSGWRLILYARRPSSLEPFRDTAAAFASNPAELAAQCQILCLCVVSEQQVEDILFGQDGAAARLARGSAVVVHSTISPEACVRLAARLAKSGIEFVDAPVSGGPERARSGSLTMMLGGQGAVIARLMKLFETQARVVLHLGDIGKGQMGKLINNSLFFVQLSLVDEVLKLADAMELNDDRVLEMIDSGTAASWASSYWARTAAEGRSVLQHETAYPGGARAIAQKDLDLFVSQLEKAKLGHIRIGGLASGAVRSLSIPIRKHIVEE